MCGTETDNIAEQVEQIIIFRGKQVEGPTTDLVTH